MSLSKKNIITVLKMKESHNRMHQITPMELLFGFEEYNTCEPIVVWLSTCIEYLNGEHIPN